VLEVTLDNETRLVRTGESIFKPRGSAHAFAVAGEAPARFLETITPAGFEGYFRAVAAAVRETGGLDRERADRLMAEYGVRSVTSSPRAAPAREESE